MSRQSIRVLVLGDEKVGKTSLILAMVSDNMPSKIPKLKEPIIIAPTIGKNDVPTIMIDTTNDDNHINEELKECNVVLLVYDISREETLDNLSSIWLPRIHEIAPKVPVIVVANKIDLINSEIDPDDEEGESAQKKRIHRVLKKLIRDFPQVEMGLECTAALMKNVSAVLYCAQRAVLFPLAPLYKTNEKCLTPAFIKALKRIFRICDKDQDGVLNDDELISFQNDVFKIDLPREDIKGIKQVIATELGSYHQEHKGITQDGFLALQKKCIEMLKIQHCWTIVEHFGYNKELKLDPAIFDNEMVYNQENGQSLEFSTKALFFLKQIFKLFAQKEYIYLTMKEFEDIFAPAPDIPWSNIEKLVPMEKKDLISFDSWNSLWTLLLYEDYKRAYYYLNYIGYTGSLAETFVPTEQKLSYSSLKKLTERNVLKIAVIGTQGCGKTQMINVLLNRPFSNKTRFTSKTKSICLYHKKKYLIITEIPEVELKDFFTSPDIKEKVDFICIMFESSITLRKFGQNFFQLLPTSVPKFFLQTMSDLGVHDNLADPVMNELGTKVLKKISSKNHDLNGFFDAINEILEKPKLSLSDHAITTLKDSKTDPASWTGKNLVIASVLGGIAIVGGWRWISKAVKK